MADSGRTVGYVLKGYGRTSETFISNEIALLEEAGLGIRVYSLKRLTEELPHGVTQRIGVPVTYLPEFISQDGLSWWKWLALNWRLFGPFHLRILQRRPMSWLRTLGTVVRLGLRFGRRMWPILTREFFQAAVIAAELQESRGDSVVHLHSHFAHTATSVAWFASQLSKRTFSFTAHAKDIYRRDMNPGDLLTQKLQAAQFTITCTGANFEYLSCLTSERGKLHRIYHGIDLRLFRKVELVPTPTPPMILSVGRFVDKKGFPDLVEACRILRDRGVDFRVRIVGGFTPLTTVIQEMIERLELGGLVSLHPAMTQELLSRVYIAATVFVLPCLITDDGDRDGIPNVLVEAMASGLPVISTDISGIPELVQDGKTGLLTPPRQPQALAAAIQELLTNEGLRSRLSISGRQMVEREFDARLNTSRLKMIFEEALQRARLSE